MSATVAFSEKTYSRLTYKGREYLPPEACFIAPLDANLTELTDAIEGVLAEEGSQARVFLQELNDGFAIRVLFQHEKVRSVGVHSHDFEEFVSLDIARVLRGDGLVSSEISLDDVLNRQVDSEALSAELVGLSMHDLSDSQRRRVIAMQSNNNREALINGSMKPHVLALTTDADEDADVERCISFTRIPNVQGVKKPENGWFDARTIELEFPEGFLSDPFVKNDFYDGLTHVNALNSYYNARKAFATLLGAAGMPQYEDATQRYLSDIGDFIADVDETRKNTVGIEVDLSDLDVDAFDDALQASVELAAVGLDDSGVELIVVYSEGEDVCSISICNHLNSPANHSREFLEGGLDEFNRVLSEKYGAIVSPILATKIDFGPK